MNDYEMMNQRVDQLRKFLDLILLDEAELAQRKKCIMDELLDTRRQITRADKLRLIKLGGSVMEQFPTDPTTIRAEARDIEIGAPGPIDDYAGWLRACADRIEDLEALLSENSLPKP